MKKVKLLLPIISMLALGSCSKLEDVSLGEIPKGGVEVNYADVKNLEYEEYNNLTIDVYDSSASYNRKHIIVNNFSGSEIVNEYEDNHSLTNINASIGFSNVKDCTSINEIKAKTSFTADYKRLVTDEDDSFYNLQAEGYIKDGKMYQSFNQAMTSALELDWPGNYYFDLNNEGTSDENVSNVFKVSFNDSLDSAGSLTYNYLASKNPYFDEIGFDVNDFPSVLNDDDTLILGYSNSFTGKYVAYKKDDKVSVGLVTSSMFGTCIITNEITANQPLYFYHLNVNKILGVVIGVKDKDGNLKNVYPKLDKYSDIYNDCDLLIENVIDEFVDIYKYGKEYLCNIHITKESLISSIDRVCDYMNEKEMLYLLEYTDVESLKNQMNYYVDVLLNDEFYFKSTIAINKYGVSKLMIDLSYSITNESGMDGYYINTLTEEYGLKLNATFNYKSKVKINYPDFSEYAKFH